MRDHFFYVTGGRGKEKRGGWDVMLGYLGWVGLGRVEFFFFFFVFSVVVMRSAGASVQAEDQTSSACPFFFFYFF